jgi:hypothetical protein
MFSILKLIVASVKYEDLQGIVQSDQQEAGFKEAGQLHYHDLGIRKQILLVRYTALMKGWHSCTSPHICQSTYHSENKGTQEPQMFIPRIRTTKKFWGSSLNTFKRQFSPVERLTSAVKKQLSGMPVCKPRKIFSRRFWSTKRTLSKNMNNKK